jgi:hypothetical protein
VQVQHWLGYHSPSSTLDRYVHQLDEDVPEPAFFDEFKVGPQKGHTSCRDGPKR